MSTQHPEIQVTLPADGNGGVLRTRVHKALSEAGFRGDADEFVLLSRPVEHDLESLLSICRQWVSVVGDVDPQRSTSYRLPIDEALAALAEPISQEVRWQYAVVNIGMFNSPGRMRDVLSVAGQHGWELITVYDKGSNWWAGMEKGFMLLKRPVPDSITPRSWCVEIRG